MKLNFKEIADAWIIAAKPTDEQKKLADERYKICQACPFFGASRMVTGDEYCKSCGCPLSKKIFSPIYDACPKHNWLEVEYSFEKILKKDNKKKDKQTIV